jgi:hypothetical protein
LNSQSTKFGAHARQSLVACLATATLMLADQALAQVGGGTGTGDDVNARVTGVLTTFQAIMFGIGGVVLAAAYGYVGYAMAWGGKRWSDVATVCYGATIGGMCSMMVGWLFS